MRGSTWPCGAMMGSRRVSSYNVRAARRIAGSGSKQRSSWRTSASATTRRAPSPGRTHAARGAENGRAAVAAERGQAVAALALPDDGLPPRELEAGLLRVGELPVVVEVIAAADRRDADGVVHAQGPAGHVDLVRAVVADLARAPAMEPVPVVKDDVVAVRGVGRRTLPQLVVEVRRHGRGLAVSDGGAGVGVPGARQVRLPDRPFLNS